MRNCPTIAPIAPQGEFWTKQQIEYARSVALHKISDDLLKSMKKMERKPDRNAFLSIGITVKGKPTPIAYYSEMELEEKVTCSNCTLEYTIYGAFAYCPDCGVHNSQQILTANFDLVLKMLDLAVGADKNVRAKLVENALEDTVSAFDGFGREHCSGLYQKLSFQNIESAKDKLQRDQGLDISDGLSSDEWNFVSEQFQKRHLLAHKMGVIDENFTRKTGSSQAMIGRKVSITEENARLLVGNLIVIAKNIFRGIARS
ncbi:MAG: hypothetical protein H8D34_12345 [Chloroflexi bacterium]|nr:hypothetical protein [Chloroflexota bacterium]